MPDNVQRLIADLVWNPAAGTFTFVLDCGHRVSAPYTALPAHIPLYAICGPCRAVARTAAKQAQKGQRKRPKL